MYERSLGRFSDIYYNCMSTINVHTHRQTIFRAYLYKYKSVGPRANVKNSVILKYFENDHHFH